MQRTARIIFFAYVIALSAAGSSAFAGMTIPPTPVPLFPGAEVVIRPQIPIQTACAAVGSDEALHLRAGALRESLLRRGYSPDSTNWNVGNFLAGKAGFFAIYDQQVRTEILTANGERLLCVGEPDVVAAQVVRMPERVEVSGGCERSYWSGYRAINSLSGLPSEPRLGAILPQDVTELVKFAFRRHDFIDATQTSWNGTHVIVSWCPPGATR